MIFMRRICFTLLLVIASGAPRAVLACPVCFGQSDSPMAWSVNMGIFAMLAVVGGVMVGFASFFVHLFRRARLAETSRLAEVGPAGSGPAEAGPHVRYGGTV